ncbi:MAG: mannose-6-phosphate isomerase [Candidatus Limnocylindrales bacterium]
MGPDEVTTVDEAFLAPLLLPSNRVYRFYRGGALLGAFRGLPDPVDDAYPEDWVGSITSAVNPSAHSRVDEGLSAVEANGVVALLGDLVREAPIEVAGREIVDAMGSTTGLLVKLLDARERLPVHCHPTREFAREILGSPFGKAEAWIVLATRHLPGEEAPNVRVGFRTDLTRDELGGLIARQDRAELLRNMVSIPVQAGSVVFVSPGLPHATGAGVFLVELQEPTDFSIVAEWSGYPIAPEDAHLGRGWDVMLDAFDRRAMTEARLADLMAPPEVKVDRPELTVSLLLGAASDTFFNAMRLEARGPAPWPLAGTFAIAIVTHGRGRIRNCHGELEVSRGDAFALFAGAPPTVIDGTVEMVVCTPPGGGRLRHLRTATRAGRGGHQAGEGAGS